ncbi:MAG: phenylalanine--tRNA ligase subunit beta, partial [Alphaproteobacteria bacterium]|nr:phenylalanine--tRNA ligase subunit beta [Alphaproteobacteria bacterium]
MRFTFNWLKTYLSTNLNAIQIAEKLTEIGLEVEVFDDPEKIFTNFKLVQIKTAEKHPNADKLQICQVVDSEGKEYRIVCGAANARKDLKSVLALPGAFIPGSNTI